MAKKIETVSEIETKKKPSLFDLIDEEIEHESKVELEAKRALFENSHETKELFDVYDDIDEQQISESVKKQDYKEIERIDALYGSEEEFQKMRERHKKPTHLKNDEKPVITLEITPQKKEKTKNKQVVRARRILWSVVLSVCFTVVFAFCVYNTIMIVDSANTLSQTEKNLQNETEDLQKNQYTYQQMVDELGESTTEVTDGMVEAGTGTIVSLEPIVEVVNPVAPTSFFDKLCSFFAKLFGR